MEWACKSTLLKLLCGREEYESGQITINGISIRENSRKYKEEVGFYLGEQWLIQKFTAAEFLNFIQVSNGVKMKDAKKSTGEWLELFELNNNQNYIESLSMGVRKVVGFISAVIIPRKLILLDEIFENLDMDNSLRMATSIEKIKMERNSSFVISTHNLERISGLLTVEKVISMDTLS